MLVRAILAVVLLVWSLAAVAEASTAVTLRGDRVQRQLLEDVSDGQLDGHDLVTAALIAGGVHDERQLSHYRQEIAKRLPPRGPAGRPVQQVAEDCLRQLHESLLTGRYHVEYSELGRVLDEGHFNCVTATVLYVYLCQRSGLDPRLMATREHVFVRFDGDPDWDVETTCLEWFDRLEAETLEAVADSETMVRQLSVPQLLGKIYYNRAVRMLGDRQFREAIELLQISLQLDPDDGPARENLLAAVNNWSLAECKLERFESAAELLAWGRELDAGYEPFAANDLHVHQRWVLALCRQRQFERALEVLAEGHARRPDAPVFDEGRLAVYRLWAEDLFTTGRSEEAWHVLETARSIFAGDPRWAGHEEAALRLEAGRGGSAVTEGDRV